MEKTTNPQKKKSIKKLLVFLIPIIIIIVLVSAICLLPEKMYTVTEADYSTLGTENTHLEYIYNSNGRLASITENGKDRYVYSYSDDFKTVTVENKNDNTKKILRFNDNFDIIEKIYSDGTTESYTYKKGKLISSKNTSDITTEYKYKGKKLINEIYSNGDRVDYEYSWSRILSETITTPTGERYYTFYHYNEDKTIQKKDMIYEVIHYTYDDKKRVISKTNTADASMSFTYDEHDNITSIIYPMPAAMKYTYTEFKFSKEVYKQNKSLITYNDVIENEAYELLR